MAVVLLVEDNDVARTILRKYLERGAHQVIACASVAAAEEAFMRSKVDVVITDLCMPERDGFALIRHLRTRRACPPIIVATGGAPGLPDALLAVEARGVGADRVLMKPVSMHELLATVSDVLSPCDAFGRERQSWLVPLPSSCDARVGQTVLQFPQAAPVGGAAGRLQSQGRDMAAVQLGWLKRGGRSSAGLQRRPAQNA